MSHSIYRDRWGIPHLRAGSADELSYLQGVNAAQDRAWQIEVERWRSLGRLSEHVGAAEVSWDTFARRVRLDDTARRCYERLDDATRRWIASYVDGVNATLPQTDAPEFTDAGVRPGHWEPWAPLGIFAVQHILFGTFPNKLWRAHVTATLGESAAFGAPEPGGSNAWAEPYRIAGDPHRVLELPGIYQQVRLTCPEFDVAGLAFPGVPGLPHFGHAGDVAWAVTNAMADYQDLYVEELRRDGDRVLARSPSGGFEPVARHVETLLVRGGDPVGVEVIETPRGPIIDRDLSLRVPARVDFDLGFGALLPLLRSRTVDDVAAALECWVEPVNSVLAADTTGAVLSLVAGRVPVRDDRCRRVPVEAWEPRYAWTGYAPMPRTPGTTFVNANDRRDGDTADFGVDFAPPHRAHRIARLAGEPPEVVHTDVLDPHDWLDRVTPRTAAGRDLHDRLRAWDRRMSADSAEAGAYAAWRSTMVRKLAAHPSLAPLHESHSFDPLFAPWLDPTARIGHALDRLFDPEIAADAMDEVAAGPPTGTWGARHTLYPITVLDTTRLDGPPVELSGDTDCVMCTASTPGVSDLCWRGSVARYVWDLHDRSRSRWIVPFGASGNPRSAHFADQLPLWTRGDLIPVF